MNKLTSIRIKQNDGTYSDDIPVQVLAENVVWTEGSTVSLTDILGLVKYTTKGSIQHQLDTFSLDEVENARVGADDTQYQNLKARLDGEYEDLLDAIAAVATNLQTLTGARSNADTAIRSDLSSEITSRINGDNLLSGQITSEVAARQAAMNSEVTARNNAINSAIASEVTNRNSAIAAEASTRASADTTLQTNINVEKARIDQIAALPSGSTSGDAELIDIRVGADGVTYTDAGTAVRTQISNISESLKYLNSQAITWTDGAFIRQAGEKASASYSYTGYIEVIPKSNVRIHTFMSTLARICVYDINHQFIEEYANSNSSADFVLTETLADNAAYIRASCLTANKGQFSLQTDFLNEFKKKVHSQEGFYYVSDYSGSDDVALDAAIADAVAYDGYGTVVIDKTLHLTYGHYISYNQTYYTGISIISERDAPTIELLQAKYMPDEYWDIICESNLALFHLFSFNCDKDGNAILGNDNNYHDISYSIKNLRIKNASTIDSSYVMGHATMDVIWHSLSTLHVDGLLTYGFRHTVYASTYYAGSNENYNDFSVYRNITALAPQGSVIVSRHGDNDIYENIIILYASRNISEPLIQIIKTSNASIDGLFIKCVTEFDGEVNDAAVYVNSSTLSVRSVGLERNQYLKVFDVTDNSVIDITAIGQKFAVGTLMNIDSSSKAHFNGISCKNISVINSANMFSGTGTVILTSEPIIIKTTSDTYTVNANIIENLF